MAGSISDPGRLEERAIEKLTRMDAIIALPKKLPVAAIARELNLPYCPSTAGSRSIEGWARLMTRARVIFQLYMPYDEELTISLLRRAIEELVGVSLLAS